jgi:hypothetical protein
MPAVLPATFFECEVIPKGSELLWSLLQAKAPSRRPALAQSQQRRIGGAPKFGAGSGNGGVVLPVTNRKVVWQRTEIGTMTPNRSYPRSSDHERISYGKF